MNDLASATVYDVVLRLPKTLSPNATVADAVAALQDAHVHMLLITDEDARLLGTLVRADLEGVSPSERALTHAVLDGRTLAPEVGAEAARELLIGRGERRRAVVTPDGRLVGLLCLKRRQHGFCSDAEVAARAADRA